MLVQNYLTMVWQTGFKSWPITVENNVAGSQERDWPSLGRDAPAL